MVGVDGGLIRFGRDRPLALDSGARLNGVEIAYRTYGRLNADALATRSWSAMR